VVVAVLDLVMDHMDLDQFLMVVVLMEVQELEIVAVAQVVVDNLNLEALVVQELL
jgi:hypothetical protein